MLVRKYCPNRPCVVLWIHAQADHRDLWPDHDANDYMPVMASCLNTATAAIILDTQ